MNGFLRFTRTTLLIIATFGLCQAANAQEDEVPTEDGQVSAQAIVDAGREQFNAGEYEAAVNSFTTVVNALKSRGPSQELLQLLVFRAKAYAQLEEYEAALGDLKEGLTYAQGNPAIEAEIRNTRGEVYMEAGAYQLALPDLQSAAAADRANGQYQFNLGKAEVKLGLSEPGEKALTKWLESGEDLPEQKAEALMLRGQAYASLAKYDKARADLAASLAIDSNEHEVYFTLGSIALQEKNYAEAAEQLSLAIKNYTPEDEDDTLPFVQGHLTRAFCLEELGKEQEDQAVAVGHYQAAAAECQQLINELDEDNPELGGSRSAALFRLGVVQRLQGDYADAIRSLSKAIQINPALGEAYFRRGICFFYQGEELLAIRDFEQAAGINFDSPRSNLWKGMAWAKLNDYDAAIRAYGEAVAVSDRYVPAFVNRGLAHLQQRDFEKAIGDFNEAIRLQPTEATHYYRRGRAYSLSGDREDAIQSYMNAVAYDGNLRPALLALADELEANGQRALGAEYRSRAGE
ncbi:tetratricopeptide repeat protein [Botrimarina hoheduenensis]|uniref:Lipoprotein NlpI n=1 Tax=Botrimarina hoheduenensis TaxID=2528000 RepID=A0A5C5W9R5_9BACT|nr:tetratricopeptide repeat protein [Botrimarina hoheduenensis]TWT47237.1 lipoprotein NlpI [Botrimarina hoheduenensis]